MYHLIKKNIWCSLFGNKPKLYMYKKDASAITSLSWLL